MPIIVFIMVDELWGTLYGLITAVIIGLGELGYRYIKEQRIEGLILIDVGLIVALGIVSISLDNAIFFKLKPGIISLMLTGFIGFSAFSKRNLMLQMTQRYMRGINLHPFQIEMMQQSMKRLFGLLLVYSLATIATSFLNEDTLWKLLNSAGLFAVIAIFMAMEWVVKHRQTLRTKH